MSEEDKSSPREEEKEQPKETPEEPNEPKETKEEPKIIEKEEGEKFDNSFRNDLWDGTKKIYDRYDAGKKTLTDMISIFKLRAEAEEKFIKDMNTISNKTHSLREGGTCGTSWLDIRNSHKELSKSHTNVFDTIKKDIIAPLEQFKKEKQQIKDKLNTDEKNLNHQLKSSKEKVESLREKYHSLSDQAEVALLTLKKARADPNFDKKKLVKLEENNNRLSSESIKAHEQYKTTLSELNIFQKKYEEEMHTILQSLQDIEEERMDFVKQIAEKYIDLNEKYIQAEQEVFGFLKVSVSKMNRQLDLRNWIEVNKTGIESKEIPILYDEYKQKYGGDVSSLPKPKNSLLSKFGFGKKGKKTDKKDTDKKETDKPRPTTVSNPTNTSKETKTSTEIKSVSGSKEPPKEKESPSKTESTPENTSDVEVVDVKKARAVFDFTKTEDNELSFKIGDILNITRIDESGWWEAELNGEIGLIPGNYLQLLENEEPPKKDEPPKKEEPKEEPKKEEPKKEEPKKEEPKKEEPKKEEPKKEEPKKELPKKDEPKEEPKKEEPKKEEPQTSGGDDSSQEEGELTPIGKCVALYDFPGDEEDELTVRAGEVVIIYAEVEGWCTGTNEAGEYGMVPANYLSPIKPL